MDLFLGMRNPGAFRFISRDLHLVLINPQVENGGPEAPAPS